MSAVLLDEGVPRLLAERLRGHGIEAKEFPNAWKHMADASVLDAAEAGGFGCLISCDQNMPFQTPLRGRRLAVLLLTSRHLPNLLNAAPDIARRLERLEPGRYAILGREGSLPDPPPRKPL